MKILTRVLFLSAIAFIAAYYLFNDELNLKVKV